MIRKKAIILFLFSFLLSSCQKGEEKTLVIIDSQVINKETVTDREALANSIIRFLLSSPLVYSYFTGENSKAYYVLAEEVKVQPGNKAVEVSLYEGIRFHDGREFTARDIPPLVEILRKKLINRYGEIYQGLTCEVLDSSRFRVTNAVPIHDMELFLSKIFADSTDVSDNLMGTGPFRFGRWIDGGVELVANRDYFEGAPFLDKVVYLHEEDERKRLYKLLKGEADLMIFLTPEVASFLEKDDNFYVRSLAIDTNAAILFNNRSPLFSDRRVRKALSLAIDRESIIEKVLKGAGVLAFSPFPEGESRERASQRYRPREALRLLQEAGWIYGPRGRHLEKNGEQLRFTLYVPNDYENYDKVADLISQQLFEIGVEVEHVPIDSHIMLEKALISLSNEAFLASSGSLAHTFFRAWHSDSDWNYARFSNKEADRLLERLQTAKEKKGREAIYGMLGVIFDDEVPAAFLYRDLIYTAVSKRFKGAEDFVGDISNIYKIKDWSVNENFR